MDKTQLTTRRQQVFQEACQQALSPPQGWQQSPPEAQPITCMGLSFTNRLGIAAGFDQTGALGRMAGALGFGAIEIGNWQKPKPPAIAPTTTASPTRAGLRLAASLAESPELETIQLLKMMEACWWVADYFCLAPQWLSQTTDFRQLHSGLYRLIDFRNTLQAKTRKQVPLVIKLKLNPMQRDDSGLIPYLAGNGIDGILLAFDFGKPFNLDKHRLWQAPDTQRDACRRVEHYHRQLRGQCALITNGGVYSKQHYQDRLAAGAELVQLHNALVFSGTDIGHKILQKQPAQSALPADHSGKGCQEPSHSINSSAATG